MTERQPPAPLPTKASDEPESSRCSSWSETHGYARNDSVDDVRGEIPHALSATTWT